jgi:hypothetical protein
MKPGVRSTEVYKLLHSLFRNFNPPRGKTFFAGLYDDLCFSLLKNHSNKITELTVSVQTVSVCRHTPKANSKNLTRNFHVAAEDYVMASPTHYAACKPSSPLCCHQHLRTADKLNATSTRGTQKYVILTFLYETVVANEENPRHCFVKVKTREKCPMDDLLQSSQIYGRDVEILLANLVYVGHG